MRRLGAIFSREALPLGLSSDVPFRIFFEYKQKPSQHHGDVKGNFKRGKMFLFFSRDFTSFWLSS